MKNYSKYIKEHLDDFINDLFFKIQVAEDIKTGDISPDLLFELDEKIEALTDTINKVLAYQKGEEQED